MGFLGVCSSFFAPPHTMLGYEENDIYITPYGNIATQRKVIAPLPLFSQNTPIIRQKLPHGKK